MPTLTIVSRDASHYKALLEDACFSSLSICAFRNSELITEEGFETEILLADPGLIIASIDKFKQLQWMQSTWAGNAPLLQHKKHDYKLTGVKDIFGDYMREFIFAYLLFFSRNISGFKEKQAQKNWEPANFNQLKGKTLGLLGVGSIGRTVAQTAKHFGMQVVGMARTPREADMNVDQYYTPAQKQAFAKTTDYLVSLLPDTPETKHFIDRDFLRYLKPECVLINAGRGNTIKDEDLIAALEEERIRAAVLDVFEQEPLQQNHRYWSLENVFVTNHTAAISYPEDISRIFCENYRRFLKQEPLMYELSFEQGY